MKTINTTIILLFASISFLNAQVIQDVQGQPVFERSYTDVTGSPYLYEEFRKGNVELTDHKIFKDLKLKYNSYANEVYYKDAVSGADMNFVTPVKKFELIKDDTTEVYCNGFPDLNNFDNKTYYQVLVDGKSKLLFKKYKTLLESKEYNSATSTKTFSASTGYFFFKDGTISRIRPSKKEFLSVFKDKEGQIKTYIDKEVIDYKSNVDLIKLVAFYNSLE